MTTIDRLWYTRCPAPTPFGIAIQQGWLDEEFHAEGWDINALQDASDPVIRQSHYTHSQPHSFRQGGNIPALWARAQGADTRVIGLTWVDEFQGLIALLDPVVSIPAWTALVFDHAGFAEAMHHLFEDRWQRASEFGD